ncbi:uncharacterized protein LOC125141384 [Tachysurus fulvidraco]|uniref:uncharacterized protein LOC125141384 n=1 Tax=Tachysurus fulvidraco TaxID=1234273 RepID=UPI001FEF79B9|nr:uncharacterized protein LOC125141384 [Tachysurus fulvidraco]
MHAQIFVRPFLKQAVEAAQPTAATQGAQQPDQLLNMKTLEVTTSMAQVLLGLTMLGDNMSHIAKEAKCSGSAAVIDVATVAIVLEAMLLLFLAFSLMDMNTIEATSSLAQVLLGLTMLGDNIGHIAREVKCGDSVAIIGLAVVAVILEVLLLFFLGYILWKTPRSQRRTTIINRAFLVCVTIHMVLRVVIIALVSAQHCQVLLSQGS